MKVYRDLEVTGDPSQISLLLDKLLTLDGPPWSRDTAKEGAIGNSGPATYYAFRCEERDGLRATHVFVARRDLDCLFVPNAIPEDNRGMACDEYNAVIVDFHDNCIAPLAFELGLKVALQPETLAIEDLVNEEVAQRLRSFSTLANKSTGSSHPLDGQRWRSFIIAAHESDAALTASDLRALLEEDLGWYSARAQELAIEYEHGRQLLRQYCKRRT